MRGKDKKPRRKRMSYTTTPASVRFWRYVDKETGAPCWLWTGATSPRGYGRFRPGPTGVPMVGPHRFSFELHNGQIASGLVVMHSCDNPKCCAIEHLSLGTHKDNMQDAQRKNRLGLNSKFSHTVCQDMFLAHQEGETQVSIAARYETTQAAVWNCIKVRYPKYRAAGFYEV